MLIVFFVLAFVAVGTAMSMLLTRNAVYSALFLVLNFGTVAMLYLILGAPFIALSQITVYAGSVVVLFLFVIMLLGAERMPGGEPLKWQRFLAIPLHYRPGGGFRDQHCPRWRQTRHGRSARQRLRRPGRYRQDPVYPVRPAG